jgi:translation initiation factor IF-2
MPNDLSTVAPQPLARVTLNLVIMGDGLGSLLALCDSLEPLSTPEVLVQVIHQGVGTIGETDVMLASARGALVIGFRVGPTREAVRMADREDVDIRLFSVIHEAVEEVKSAIDGLLAGRKPMLATAKVRDVFRVPRVGELAGCLVTSGVLKGGSRIRVIRDGSQVYEGMMGSLRRFKEEVGEVREGLECSVIITSFLGLKAGDVLECHPVEEVAHAPASAAAEV